MKSLKAVLLLPASDFFRYVRGINYGYMDVEGVVHHISPADNCAEQNVFLEAMADAASTVVRYFGDKIVCINIMANMSVDCDCCAVAEDPCMKDIGILASTDPIAIDQACIDLVKQSNDPGKEHFLERVNSRNGTHTIDSAAELGYGTKEYELINVE